jgi:hypothetical protein
VYNDAPNVVKNILKDILSTEENSLIRDVQKEIINHGHEKEMNLQTE